MLPVTAKLSQRFYQKLGDDVTNELVEWFNAVDLAYRTELRELNELNFARFDAKLEQRIAELRAELRQEMAEFKTEVRREFAEFKAEIRHEVAEIRYELAEIRRELGEFKTETRQGAGALSHRLDTLQLSMQADMQALRGSMLRWMFGFWVTTLLALAGLTATLLSVEFGR